MWLLRGLQFGPGRLDLQNDRLRLTLLHKGAFFDFQLHRLAREFDVPALADRLDRGEQVPLVEVTAQELEGVRSPRWRLGTALQFRVFGRSLRVSLVEPAVDHRLSTLRSAWFRLRSGQLQTRWWRTVLGRARGPRSGCRP